MCVCIYIYICIYIYQALTHGLKVQSTIIRYVKCFVLGVYTSKNLFIEIESMNSDAPGRSTSFEQKLVG